MGDVQEVHNVFETWWWYSRGTGVSKWWYGRCSRGHKMVGCGCVCFEREGVAVGVNVVVACPHSQ